MTTTYFTLIENIQHFESLWFPLIIEVGHTGKSLSEALMFAITNPQYEDIFFIELQVQYMKIPSSEHVVQK